MNESTDANSDRLARTEAMPYDHADSPFSLTDRSPSRVGPSTRGARDDGSTVLLEVAKADDHVEGRFYR